MNERIAERTRETEHCWPTLIGLMLCSVLLLSHRPGIPSSPEPYHYPGAQSSGLTLNAGNTGSGTADTEHLHGGMVRSIPVILCRIRAAQNIRLTVQSPSQFTLRMIYIHTTSSYL